MVVVIQSQILQNLDIVAVITDKCCCCGRNFHYDLVKVLSKSLILRKIWIIVVVVAAAIVAIM